MSLSEARGPGGQPIALLGEAPYDGEALEALEGVRFRLPCGDPWIRKSNAPEHVYLESAREAWELTPEWMDFLDLESPANDIKRASRDIYLHHWAEHLGGRRVLDVGCGIGRLTHPFLDRGATVIGIDADLASLQRCAWYAARRPGYLDLYWTTTARLPEVGQFDTVVACESLNYVPDVQGAVAAIVERMVPGGVFLLAVEAEWGWVCGPDAPEGGLETALSGGVLDLPGDRWVRTMSREALCELLEAAGLVVEKVVPTHYLIDGPLEDVMPGSLSLEELLEAEERCRQHPVWAPLNRIWTAVARRPA